MLEFADVSFRYGGRAVLDRVSFALGEEACAALIGPNGVGKTTLLRLACGLLRPDTGQVLLRGQPVSGRASRWVQAPDSTQNEMESHSPGFPHHRQARSQARAVARTVALVPQNIELPFAYTVEQVVMQGRTPHLRLLRGPGAFDRGAVDRALERTGLSELRRRVVNELSGGERQRVKLALGLAQEPALLLLDEPLQSLDVGRQAELLALLRVLRVQGVAMLAAMHDLHLVEANFSEVLLLSPGGSLQRGTPRQMLAPQVVAKAFGLKLDGEDLR